MTASEALFVSGTISLLALIAAYIYLYRTNRQPSLALWSIGWLLTILRFLALVGTAVSTGSRFWHLIELASLGLASFFLFAGTRASAGRLLPQRSYAWAVLLPLLALLAWLPLDYRLLALPTCVLALVLDAQAILVLLRLNRTTAQRYPAVELPAVYLLWALLKMANLLTPNWPAGLPAALLTISLATLALAFALIVFSLIDAENSAQRRAERIKVLSTLTAAAGRLLSPDELLETALDELSRLLKLETPCGVILLTPETEQQSLVLATGRHLPDSCQHPAPENDCACCRAIRSGQLVLADEPAPSTCPPVCQHALAVPLTARSEVLGALCITLPPSYHLSEGDRRTLESAGQQLGLALNNARLYQDTQDRLQELSVLNKIALQVNAALDLEQVLQAIKEEFLSTLGFSTFHIALYDAERNVLDLRVIVDQGQIQPTQQLDLAQSPGLSGWVIHSHQPLWIDDLEQEREHLPIEPVQVGGLPRSLGMVPLLSKGQVGGILSVQSYQPHAFTPSMRRLVNGVANQVATAIENSRLYQAERQARELTERLRETALLISTSLDLQEVLEMILDQLGRVVPYDNGGIHILENDASRVIAVRNWPPEELGRLYPLDEYPYDRQLAQGEGPIVIHDTLENDWGWQLFEELGPVRSNIGVPLLVRQRVIGSLIICSYQPGKYNQADARIVQDFAQQAATAIENANLYADQQRRVQETDILLETANALNSTLELTPILKELAIHAARACQAQRCTITLLDEKEETLYPLMAQFATGQVQLEMWHQFQRDSYPRRAQEIREIEQVIQTRRPLFIPDARQTTLPAHWIEWFAVRSLLLAPLVSQERVIGLIALDRPVVNQPFTTDQVNMAMAIGAQAAAAIERSRLYQQTARRLAQTLALRQVMLAASSTLDQEQVLQRTLDAMQREIGEYVGLTLLDEQRGQMRIYMPEAITDIETQWVPLEGSVCGRVLQSGDPLLIGNVDEIPYYFKILPGMHSELAVPIYVDGQAIGVLNAESPQRNAFDQQDLAFYTALAGQLGMALENVRLYQEVQEKSAQLSLALQELQDLDRLRTEVIQNVNHELRTPLTLIQGYTEYLLSGDLGPLQPAQRQALEIVYERSATFSRLIHNLSALRALPREKIQLATLYVPELVERALSTHRRAAARNQVEFTTDWPDDLPPILGDGEYLGLAFSHLIDNAVKFSPNGGLVTVRARLESDAVHIAISDQGIGIAPENLAHIFDRFYQADGSTTRRFGGMGIGLALVWEVITAHQGKIKVESQPGQGSVFTVTLPVQNPASSTR